MKRFYKAVSTARQGQVWQVLLDDKPIRTPMRQLLELPTEALALAIASEWEAQHDEVRAPDMRLTRLATTAIDLMPARREPAIRQVMEYLETDMLCYRAGNPADLARRQDETWQPWLDWLERSFDVRLPVFRTMLPQPVPREAALRLTPVVEGMDPWHLVALHAAVTATSSLVLGLAMVEAVLGPDEAFEAALLDDLYQVEHWGEDPEITKRHVALRSDLEAIGQFVAAVAPPLRM
ncbi:MAG TPA: ATP12 family protein [Geminicoccus sp.]|jgi:chaperone required for assembly of F1-ATPase|uniref:ATP12 family chaperone protein n=1 Tax=Geminicoccus sp. TaxID=2024832 RepID=UPI002E315726|nr:ATP12 family protein [Geminicoccus sp.]HEX2526793.1 ATP12 family protein [Geminicoccus sp.]